MSKVFAICENKCLEETMTKTDIETSITDINNTIIDINNKINNHTHTDDNDNVSVGINILTEKDVARDNVAIGVNVLAKNINATNNVAIGNYALENVVNGGNNVAVGYRALQKNVSTHNVAIGLGALERNSFGYCNVAIGSSTLMFNTDENYNTAVGNEALSNLKLCTNCTGLGNNAQVTGDNQVQLGNAQVTVYAQKAIQTRSDARDKIDIKDTSLGLNFIEKLKPREFRLNSRELYFEKDKERDFSKVGNGSKAGKRFHQGLIAQEVKEVIDELGIDFAGYQDHKINGGEDVLSIGYTELIGPLIKAVQELSNKVKVLEHELQSK